MEDNTKYIIYRILNLITRKIYIGKTKRTLGIRWKCHLYESTTYRDKMRIHEMIREHGKENFEIKQIDIAYGLKHSQFLESFYILYYQSNEAKYGYNSIVYDLFEVENEQYRLEKISLCAHACGKTYIYPDKRRGLYVVRVIRNGVNYTKTSKNPELLKETVDKLNIALYNDYNDLYFPERVEEYKSINFEDYLKTFNKNKKIIGVSWGKTAKTYSSYVYFNKKLLTLGRYKTEIEAAVARDKVNYFLYGESFKKFNLPELIDKTTYIQDGKILFERTTAKNGKPVSRRTLSKYVGVWKLHGGRWAFRFTKNKIHYEGTASTEIEAAKQRDILAIKYGSKRLNFPELTTFSV